MEEGGGREKRKLTPLPLHSFFLLSSQFSRRTRAEPLATQASLIVITVTDFEANIFHSWEHLFNNFLVERNRCKQFLPIQVSINAATNSFSEKLHAQ